MRKSFLEPEENNTKDNYRALCEKWRLIYLGLDREELKERFCLESDEEAYYIVFYQETYRLDKESGMITLKCDPDRRLSFDTVMSIYHLFY